MTAVECNGDRLLVQKLVFDFRPARRWEVAVFHYPGDPSQAYVKRVVGVPGDSLQIIKGDIVVDGKVARKSLREQRAMRILVYDNEFLPRGIQARYPQFVFRRGLESRAAEFVASERESLGFVHEPANREPGPLDRTGWNTATGTPTARGMRRSSTSPPTTVGIFAGENSREPT